MKHIVARMFSDVTLCGSTDIRNALMKSDPRLKTIKRICPACLKAIQ